MTSKAFRKSTFRKEHKLLKEIVFRGVTKKPGESVKLTVDQADRLRAAEIIS